MPDLIIIRGDSYALRRPLYTYTIVDDLGGPFNLSGCTVRTTFKTAISPIDLDPNDELAVIKHQVAVDLSGVATSTGLVLQGPATAGIVRDHFTAAETRILQTDIRFVSDLQLTDAAGEIFTWMWDEGIMAIDSVTNRST
jgi:hypothetical protein